MNFDESTFKNKVNTALDKVRTILENNRLPKYPADVPHEYNDKYVLAEFLTNTALAAQLNCLESLGLDEKKMGQLVKWSKSRSVTIRLKAEERCVYNRETTRKVTDPVEHVREYGGVMGAIVSSVTDKVVRNITEHFWDFDFNYELFAFEGNNPDQKVTLRSRKGGCEIMTTTKTNPRKESTVFPSVDYNFTYLLQNITDDLTFKFSIDRTVKSCRTPRRNDNIDEAISHFNSFQDWARRVHSYFTSGLFTAQQNHALDLGKIGASGIFVPVIPLFEESTEGRRLALAALDAKPSSSSSSSSSSSKALANMKSPVTSHPVLLLGDVNQFLTEQKRTIQSKFAELAKMFKDDSSVITVHETTLCTAMLHAVNITQHFTDGVDCIENMLYTQLVAALGKVVTPIDFIEYMKFHNRKVFRDEFQPRVFCYAIRRPEHYPEGVLSIDEQRDDGTLVQPIQTVVRHAVAQKPMYFAISAGTRVGFLGDRYLHGWVQHSFSGQSGAQFHLTARARQFSIFMVLIGKILTGDTFEPKYAFVCKDKDEFKIPLTMEQIPTPKEFRDAIESLSPEQQRFAKAYRSMQLSSTLFGVAVIQIKPQLEKVLKLPSDSLTKEIQLTTDLLELFIKYQLPTDLLSFDAAENLTPDQKVEMVRHFVREANTMIEDTKTRELDDQKMEFQYARPTGSVQEVQQGIDQLIPEPVIDVDYDDGRRYKKKKKGFIEKIASLVSPRKMRYAEMSMAMDSPMYEEKSKSKSVEKEYDSKEKKKFSKKSEAVHSSLSRATGSAAPTAQVAPVPSAPSTGESAAPTATDAPASTTTTEQKQVQPKEEVVEEEEEEDYTKIPGLLDKKFDELDEDSALRPTIIDVGTIWQKKTQRALLTPLEDEILNNDEQLREKTKAFDLLDCLSRSGSLMIDQAELHVILASTHCFDKSLISTVIQDNINPIEKVERSTFIVATTVHNKPAAALLLEEEVERASTYSPALFIKSVEEEKIPAIQASAEKVH